MNSFDLDKEKNLFLVPEMPTPNGRIHLGHVSGPYLKMDVLKKKAIRNGAVAYLVSGSDAFESYVELKSEKTGLSEKEVANKYHDLIVQDFSALEIDFDLFLNPFECLDEFTERHIELGENLVRTGSVKEVEEVFYYDEQNKRYLTGCWLKGKCPNCNSDTGSYLCEDCGTHFKPSDIFDSKNYLGATKQVKKSIFLKLDVDLIKQYLTKSGVNNDFIKIFEDYIALQGEYVRLTTEQKTGIPFGQPNQVLYTYTTLWFFSLFCGDLIKKTKNLEKHPFDKESDFLTVSSFGIDNAIPYLGGVLGAGMNGKEFHHFDYFLPNYFYHLNGRKFSTSRLHVIWGADIVSDAKISPDSVRYYLVYCNPEFETKNLDIHDFVKRVNSDLAGDHNTAINACLKKIEHLTDIENISEKWMLKLNELLKIQNTSLQLDRFNLGLLTNTINDWVSLINDNQDELTANTSYWMLKGYALLAMPVMPNMSLDIWKKLGHDKPITLEDFFEKKQIVQEIDVSPFENISIEQLLKCLPVHLRS